MFDNRQRRGSKELTRLCVDRSRYDLRSMVSGLPLNGSDCLDESIHRTLFVVIASRSDVDNLLRYRMSAIVLTSVDGVNVVYAATYGVLFDYPKAHAAFLVDESTWMRSGLGRVRFCR